MKSYSKMFRNITVFVISMATIVTVIAQTNQESTETSSSDEVYQLSPFAVSTEEDVGYRSQNTLVGSRSAKSLMDIPSSIAIINKEVIDDLNAISVHQLLAVGVSGVTQNQTINDDLNFRGFRTTGALRDGTTKATYKLNPLYDVARVEVIKGPGAMLLGNNSFLGGAVNFITQSATSKPAADVRVSYMGGSLNSYRATANASGPLTKSDDVMLNYRVTLGASQGDPVKTIMSQDELFIGGGFALYYGSDTSLVFNAYYFRDDSYRYWDDFLDLTSSTPKLNQYSTESFSPARAKDVFWKNQDSFANATFLTKLSPNSSLRVYGAAVSLIDRRRIIAKSSLLADNYTLTRVDIPLVIDDLSHSLQVDYIYHLHNDSFKLDTYIGGDMTKGRFRQGQSVHVGGLPNIDTRFPETMFVNDDAYFSQDSTRPGVGLPNNNYDTENKRLSFSYYFQENLSLFKDRLILVGGLRWFAPGGSDQNFITNAFTNSNDTVYKTHKYGIVVKPIPSVAIYYTDAENTFVQTGRVDKFMLGDLQGEFLRDRQGILREGGVKFDHKLRDTVSLYGSVAYFRMMQTNVSTVGILENGQPGRVQSAQDESKGFEVDLGMRFEHGSGYVDSIFTVFDGDSATAVNPAVEANGFVKNQYSFLLKSTWTTGALAGIMLGGSVMDQGPKREGVITNNDLPVLINLFGRYTWRKHWNVQINLENVGDKAYAVATSGYAYVQAVHGMQPSITLQYKW